jgi:hypothetical protein
VTPRRVVLVTGTPRSGTTPVGDALASAPGVRTLYEPLNFHVGDRRVRHYFEVPGADGFPESLTDQLITDIARLRLHLRPGVFPEDHGWRRLAKYVTGSRTLMTYRLARLDRRATTLVWKDPFAVFLARRAAAVHGIPVFVTFRPAHAVAASFKRLRWSFDVDDLLTRMDNEGERYRTAIAGLDLRVPAQNGAALWFVVNDWLLRASQEVAGITFVDLERLVEDRAGVLRALYALLDLPWTGASETHVRSSAIGDGPAAPEGSRAHGGRRDPSAVNRYWVNVLDADDVDRIEELTGDLAGRLRAAAITAHGQPPPPP